VPSGQERHDFDVGLRPAAAINFFVRVAYFQRGYRPAWAAIDGSSLACAGAAVDAFGSASFRAAICARNLPISRSAL
jgi:hypothetical protein